ncbi:calcium-binding protein [Gemmobacter lutimaris]|nr:calcium-binding protein [Gemmobacter lutimaris]
MTITSNVTNIYAFDGTLLDITTGGIISASLINVSGGPNSGSFIDNNGQLTTDDNGITTFALGGGSGAAITYLGSGTIQTLTLLGIPLLSRPVAAFQVGGQIYLYAPDGLPLLSGVLVDLTIDADAPFTLPATSNGVVEGLDTAEGMAIGYTDLQGDQITSGANTVFGNGGNDTISGGSATDALYGGTGDDQILVRSNALDGDTLDGGAGTDWLDLSQLGTAFAAGTIVNMASQQIVNGGSSVGIVNFENVTGSDFSDNILGDAGNNEINAGTGNDNLVGGAGNDTLRGDDGDDTLRGGLGDDTLTGGAGTDTADYSAATARVVVELGISGVPQVISATEGSDTLLQIENILGGAGGDRLVGNAGTNVLTGNAGADNLFGVGGNDTLFGGAGVDGLYGADGADQLFGGEDNDRLFGGAGDDTLDGGDGLDFADYRPAANSGITVDLSITGAQAISASEGFDTLVNVENLSGSGFGDTLTGNADDNVIYGIEGNDTISGGGGVDRLIGGLGQDTLTGGAGADVFFFTRAADSDLISGRDTITDFVSGTDRINLGHMDADSGTAGDQEFTFLGTAAFTGVAGQLRLAVSGANSFLLGDTDGDGNADLNVALLGVTSVVVGDFIL